MVNKLNKLQIRAKVLEIIKSYKTDEDFSSKIHAENLKELKSIEDMAFILEILLKELVTAQDFELDVVRWILADFATLEMVEDTIWELLKDKNIPDGKKEIYLQLLRALGGKIDVPTLMECMQDFNAVVDQQTKSLLEIATVNPEAQVDFLDFIFSLKADEQIQLIRSLQEDFQGDELANILSPCLMIKLSDNVKFEVMDILATSNSYFAVKPFKQFIQSSDNEELKKVALKGLNKLRAAGLEIDNEEFLNLRELETCKTTKFYKAFISQVDGCGNQGLVFSRIDERGRIIVFCPVININEGIIDCFGMQNITVTDLQKVISRFRNDDMVVPISQEEVKFKLKKAEIASQNAKVELPYEYICWSVFTTDIQPKEIDYDALLTEKINDFEGENKEYIYNTEVFDTWFFEYDDIIEIKELIDFVVLKKNVNIETIEEVEAKIETIFNDVFTESRIEEYSEMLKEAAYICNLNKDLRAANICMNFANVIKEGENEFCKDIIRRSILQHLANVVAEEDSTPNPFANKDENDSEISKEEAFELLKNLEQAWD